MAKIAKKTAARRKAARIAPRRARPVPHVASQAPLAPKQFDHFQMHDAVRCVGREGVGVIVGMTVGVSGEPAFLVRFRSMSEAAADFDSIKGSHLFFA